MFQNNMGWECPKCGKVYNPSWPSCTKCTGDKITYDDATKISQAESIESILDTCYTCWKDKDKCECESSKNYCRLCGWLHCEHTK